MRNTIFSYKSHLRNSFLAIFVDPRSKSRLNVVPNNYLLEPLDARVHLNISADEQLPAGAENPWTTWKALNRLRTQVGRSRVNMLKWGFSNEEETCDCGIRQTMQHLLVCPMMDTACSPQDLTTANDIAIDCARHWEGTI